MNELIFDRFLISILIGIVGALAAEFARRKKPNVAEQAEIRRDVRRHCLDEVTALIRGEDMYSSIGADVKRAYYFAIQAANRKGKQ